MIGWGKKDVFVSYRRDTGSELAQIVYRHLWWRGYRVYLDVHNKEPGPFPPKLITRITEARDFVVILTPDCLQRCGVKGDWLGREISLAFQLQNKNIVPFRKDDFNWPESLPKDIAALPDQEWVTYSHTRSDEALRDLRKSLKSWPVRLYSLAAALLIALAAVIGALWWNGRTPEPSLSDTSRYGFERGPEGWVAQTFEDSQGCTHAAPSARRARFGGYSLEMQMDLVGGDPGKSSGEAWVNWKNTPPENIKVPADLTDHVITAWVYAPRNAQGGANILNGFQLFVKAVQGDESGKQRWRSIYGGWHNVVVEDQWFKISMKVDPTDPANEKVDPGFDPSQIIAIGVKMGIGKGSTAVFKESVFLDAVDWEVPETDTTRAPGKPNKPAATQPKEDQP